VDQQARDLFDQYNPITYEEAIKRRGTVFGCCEGNADQKPCDVDCPTRKPPAQPIPAVKYYECHVTIEPVFDVRRAIFENVCAGQRFKVAKLLMQKGKDDAAEPSKKDTFCTGHSKDYGDMVERMRALVHRLRFVGFEVLRYKIEAVVFDTRAGDSL